MRLRALRSLALVGLAASLGLGTCSFAETLPDETVGLAVASLGLELFIAFGALALAALSREPLASRLGLGPTRLSPRRLSLLVFGTLALSHGLDGILEHAELRERSALADLDAMLGGASGGALALALLGIGLAPGVAEELLCRGWIQRGLERRVGPAAAIAVAALAFGALHVDAIHAGFAAVLGLYLGVAGWLAGSIRAPILCHAANNLLAVWLVATFPDAEPHDPVGTGLALAVAGACLAGAARGALPPPAPPDPPAGAQGPAEPTAEPQNPTAAA